MNFEWFTPQYALQMASRSYIPGMKLSEQIASTIALEPIPEGLRGGTPDDIAPVQLRRREVKMAKVIGIDPGTDQLLRRHHGWQRRQGNRYSEGARTTPSMIAFTEKAGERLVDQPASVRLLPIPKIQVLCSQAPDRPPL